MMTNYDKYFGSPEKVAEMAIFPGQLATSVFFVSHCPDGTCLGIADMCRSFYHTSQFIEWLQEEAE